jgi:hypothetical protein
MSKALKYEVGDYFFRKGRVYYLDRISSIDGKVYAFSFKEIIKYTVVEGGRLSPQNKPMEEITLHYNEIFKVFDRMSRDLICTELSYYSIHQISCSVSRNYLMERNKYLTLYKDKNMLYL